MALMTGRREAILASQPYAGRRFQIAAKAAAPETSEPSACRTCRRASASARLRSAPSDALSLVATSTHAIDAAPFWLR